MERSDEVHHKNENLLWSFDHTSNSNVPVKVHGSGEKANVLECPTYVALVCSCLKCRVVSEFLW